MSLSNIISYPNPPVEVRRVRFHFGDRAFWGLTLLMALSIFALAGLVAFELTRGSLPALRHFGWSFLAGSDWDPVNDHYGALPFLSGTLVSSLIALIIAVPVSVAAAVYLAELAPARVRQPFIVLIESLAAVPSVILGLWGIFVLVPALRDGVFPWLQKWFGFLPIFSGPILGPSVLAGGVIVAIMVVPIITSASYGILRSVPDLQREAAYGLGATRWEATRIAVLGQAGKGIFGAVILGLGRALGETMAVTMVIGNAPRLAASLFAPGCTLASAIANEFNEAIGTLHVAALFELGLVLLCVTVLVNAAAQLLLKTFTFRGIENR